MKQSDQTPRPMISFIITAYNLPVALLKECIGSVLAVDLTREEREIILVDDGSDIPPLSQLLDFQQDIFFVRQTNKGLSEARNAGLDLAKGQFVQFVDGDDCLIKAGYDAVLNLLRSTGNDAADIILFEHSRVQSGKQLSRKKACRFKQTTGQDFLQTKNLRAAAWGYLFRRETAAGLRFVPGIYHEDEAFTPRLFLRAKTVFYSPLKAYFYRPRPHSITREPSPAHVAKRIDDIIAIIKGLKNEAITNSLKVLERRINQLSMDCVYQAMATAANYGQAANFIRPLRELQLFPLPLRFYTTKYCLFALATRCSLLRRLLFNYIKLTPRA
ncbi:MAG: glycosyltransferase [Prevotella sp.]|nr:glycosyltransferase [Prevotella sp.]